VKRCWASGFGLRPSLVAGRRRNLQLVGFPLPFAGPLFGVELGADPLSRLTVGKRLAAQRTVFQVRMNGQS
jgi:hypothetical protein